MTFCILIERERERDGGKSYGSSNNVEDKKFDAATQSTRIQCVCWYKMKQKKKRSRRPNHPFSCRSNGVAATSVFDYHHGPLKAAAKDICLGEWGQKLSEEEEEKNEKKRGGWRGGGHGHLSGV